MKNLIGDVDQFAALTINHGELPLHANGGTRRMGKLNVHSRIPSGGGRGVRTVPFYPCTGPAANASRKTITIGAKSLTE
ncbi:hypothetical protein GCM10022198_18710 [Klugiella xanthotipulae]